MDTTTVDRPTAATIAVARVARWQADERRDRAESDDEARRLYRQIVNRTSIIREYEKAVENAMSPGLTVEESYEVIGRPAFRRKLEKARRRSRKEAAKVVAIENPALAAAYQSARAVIESDGQTLAAVSRDLEIAPSRIDGHVDRLVEYRRLRRLRDDAGPVAAGRFRVHAAGHVGRRHRSFKRSY